MIGILFLDSMELEISVLDRFDRAILAELEKDGRIGFATLAERVGLSKTPCWNRVQALEHAGVIKGYRALLNPRDLGVGLNAFVKIMTDFDKHAAFEAAAQRHPAVIACYTTAGDSDYILHVVADGVEGLDSLLRHEISRLPGVQRSSSTVCLTTVKEHGPLTGLSTAGLSA
jgi:Lrp/AsnC family leucine-responsive transcriptional regulator